MLPESSQWELRFQVGYLLVLMVFLPEPICSYPGFPQQAAQIGLCDNNEDFCSAGNDDATHLGRREFWGREGRDGGSELTGIGLGIFELQQMGWYQVLEKAMADCKAMLIVKMSRKCGVVWEGLDWKHDLGI